MKSFIVFLAMLMITSFLVTGIVYAYDHNQKSEQPYIEVMVKSGDTLWLLAKPYFNNKGDFREFLYNIKEFNHLDNSMIYPGQIIKIPVG